MGKRKRICSMFWGLIFMFSALSLRVYGADSRELSQMSEPEGKTNLDAEPEGKTILYAESEGKNTLDAENEPKIITFSSTEVNPIYEDVITKEELERIIESNKNKSEADIIDSGSCGENATYKLYKEGDGYRLVISGSGAVTPDGGSGRFFNGTYGWSSKATKIESLIIEEGITSIEGICKNAVTLTNVSLPDGLLEIEAYSFYGCKALTGIYLPASIKLIEQNAFGRYCLGLTDIYYEGTKKQWNEIDNRDPYVSTTIIHYEAAPEDID